MYRLLNRGLNFSLLPLKLDITQILEEYKIFAKSAICNLNSSMEKIAKNPKKKKYLKHTKQICPKTAPPQRALRLF